MSAKTMKWYGEKKMNKAKKEHLRKFKRKHFVKSEKISTFANDEPTALATDVNKPTPTLTGESAIRFLERAKAVEEEVKKQMNEPPTLEFLQRELEFQKFFLEEDRRKIVEREKKIEELEKKIAELDGEK